jgi:P-type conjugative transfer protein TrbJ
MKKKLLALVIAGIISSQASASGMIAGATFPEQIVQEATQVEQLNNVVQQVQQGFQSLQNQAMNLKSLNGMNEVQSLGPLLSQLVNVAQQGTNLSYAGQNIAGQFQQTYPGWTQGQNYQSQYQNWRNTTNQNLQNELSAAGLQAQDFTNETSALNAAQNLSQTAGGRLQAIQAGTQVTSMVAQQVQQLRQLIMNQQQSQVAYQMQQQQLQDAANQTNQQAITATNAFIGTGGSNAIPSVGSFQMPTSIAVPNMH